MSNKQMQSGGKHHRRALVNEAVAKHRRDLRAKILLMELVFISLVQWFVYSSVALITGQHEPLITDHPDGVAFSFTLLLQLFMLSFFIWPMLRGIIWLVLRFTNR